ncbi:MAG: hypothetical protein WBD79_23260 [Anaerolineae bacterium]
MSDNSTVVKVFTHCVEAIRRGTFIHRQSRQDKEYHFQNWVSERLKETGVYYETGGRNSYPDFRMVNLAEGYEVKGLAHPGRENNYDCNSQVPSGIHNGRTIFYVFGRYPAEPDGDSYPVTDLVLCHGDFLNADHNYVHANRHVKGFGSYGDIMIRDRKMYVAPTPFGLLTGVAYMQTLILPEGFLNTSELQRVGTLTRREAAALVVGYDFDLRTNELALATIPNPSTGVEHRFEAWRLGLKSGEPPSLREEGASYDSVFLRETQAIFPESAEDE